MKHYKLLALICAVALISILMLASSLLISTPARAQDEGGEDLGTPTPTPLPPPPLLELNEDNIKRATVFVMQVLDSEQGPIITCVGSGTVVSSDGLILTNAHVAVASESCRSDRIVIALSLRLDEPPVPTYTAEILDASGGLDLAVLRITRFLDGRVVEAGTLQLPFVELGDSSLIALDDTIFVVGYTDIATSTVQAIRGTISGFTAEARVGDRAWLRTNAPIPGLVTGGGAYDRQGRLIGIPTIAPAIVGDEPLDCRSVQDSNGDGQVNDDDLCIPVGGFISALRPSRLARGLVRAAALGIHLDENFAPSNPPPPTDAPIFRRLFTSTGVNSAGMPINVINVLPAGTNSLYLFFDYDNMVNGMVYELRTTIDGRPSPTFSLPSVTWNGGERGMWYIGAAGVPWANGLYEFNLLIQGRQVASYQVTIGGAAQQIPAFSDIAFGLQDNLGSIVGINYVIPETNIVRAQFNYRNMTPNLEWSQVWYLEDAQLARTPLTWTGGESGVNVEAAIQSPTGLISGRYRLELYIGDVLAATADFVVAGGAEGIEADIFSDFRFAASQIGGQPQPPISLSFPANTERLYVFFNWRQLSQGTPWTWRWKVDNETIFQIDTQWAASPDGENYYISLDGIPALPDGTYTFEIEMGGIPVARQDARIGLGQLPIGAFASAEGVQLAGRILDSQTGRGIPGAIFILLASEFSVEDFLWDESQIWGMSLADENGYFQLPVLLPRGTIDAPILYSFLVRAEGYLPLNADGVPITNETVSPLELAVELNRD